MSNLEHLPNAFDRENGECKVIIETPKGRRSKFHYDPESGLFSLAHLLPEGFSFPYDFGFVPSTLAEDGDPLDVLVLMDEPAHVGCLLHVRLIGVVKLVQTEDGKRTRNDRLLAVALRSFDYAEKRSVHEIPVSTVKQVCDFLELYNKDSQKNDQIEGVGDAEAAMEIIESAIHRFTAKQTS